MGIFTTNKRDKRTVANPKAGPAPKKPIPPPPQECGPNHPCLVFLRRAAAAERKAVLFYLESAGECRAAQDLFLAIAEDEMRHFRLTMHLLAELDPVQARALAEVGLDFGALSRAETPKWAAPHQPPAKEVVAPTDGACCAAILTLAIEDELKAINDYQAFMDRAELAVCREHFGHLMDDEKHHLAELTSALLQLTDEILADEGDDEEG